MKEAVGEIVSLILTLVFVALALALLHWIQETPSQIMRPALQMVATLPSSLKWSLRSLPFVPDLMRSKSNREMNKNSDSQSCEAPITNPSSKSSTSSFRLLDRRQNKRKTVSGSQA
jgi:hypothetical protein